MLAATPGQARSRDWPNTAGLPPTRSWKALAYTDAGRYGHPVPDLPSGNVTASSTFGLGIVSIFRWLGNHGVLIAIVGGSIAAGIVLSVVEVDDGQDLATVLIGLTLIVSVAILAAAVTAAVYAKPAYDQAASILKPIHLSIVEFSLSDANGQLVTEDQGQLLQEAPGEWIFNPSFHSTESLPVYQSTQPLPSVLTLQVTVKNEGKGTARCAMNFQIPSECDLEPRDPPTQRLASAIRDLPLNDDVSAPCRFSIADTEIPRDISISYVTDITIPAQAPKWRLGWPMYLFFFRPGEQKNAIELQWWVSVPGVVGVEAPGLQAIPEDD